MESGEYERRLLAMKASSCRLLRLEESWSFTISFQNRRSASLASLDAK